MNPELTSPSSSSDRRISVLARHLVGVEMDPQNDSISAFPTSGSDSNSVFSHVVRGPEDPILGVSDQMEPSLCFCPAVIFWLVMSWGDRKIAALFIYLWFFFSGDE